MLSPKTVTRYTVLCSANYGKGDIFVFSADLIGVGIGVCVTFLSAQYLVTQWLDS